MDNIEKHIINYKEDIISDIQKVIRINSVRDTENKSPGAPFGPGINECLETFLQIAKDLGFKTYKDPQGYYGYAEIGDSDKELIGILGHLDTVNFGSLEQWTLGGPLSGDIVDNEIIGRGTLDDKGPLIINLYALKCLIDKGVYLKNKIRIIACTAEETTWEGVERYKQNEQYPKISYTPDSQFPLIYAEKTVIQAQLKSSFKNELFTIRANGDYNAVCDTAIYTGVKLDEIFDVLNKNNVQVSIDDNELYVYGKSAHASEAFKGKNSLISLCQALVAVDLHSPMVNFLAMEIGSNPILTKLFGEVKDTVSGDMTVNVGSGSSNMTGECFTVDIRVPVLVDTLEVVKNLITVASIYDLSYHEKKILDKILVEKDSKLVKSLTEAYQFITNDTKSAPESSGGGTFARAFDNCVGFGMTFKAQGMESLAHQPNERMKIKYIVPAVNIYYNALLNLLELD